jgi:hypothetical protein
LTSPRAPSGPSSRIRPSLCTRPTQIRYGPVTATTTGWPRSLQPICCARPAQVVPAHCTRPAESTFGPDPGSMARSTPTHFPSWRPLRSSTLTPSSSLRPRPLPPSRLRLPPPLSALPLSRPCHSNRLSWQSHPSPPWSHNHFGRHCHCPHSPSSTCRHCRGRGLAGTSYHNHPRAPARRCSQTRFTTSTSSCDRSSTNTSTSGGTRADGRCNWHIRDFLHRLPPRSGYWHLGHPDPSAHHPRCHVHPVPALA